MKDIKSLLDYFIGVNASHGEGYGDADIDAHLRLFCEQLQAKINHPFSDGGSLLDYDNNWPNWVQSHGAHLGYAAVSDGDVDCEFTVKITNLINHPDAMHWFNYIHRDPQHEVGLRFMLHGAVVDLSDDASKERHFLAMRNTVKNIEGTKYVLEQLKRDDVWDYLIPNIVITKE